jgi:hypothetical protein
VSARSRLAGDAGERNGSTNAHVPISAPSRSHPRQMQCQKNQDRRGEEAGSCDLIKSARPFVPSAFPLGSPHDARI